LLPPSIESHQQRHSPLEYSHDPSSPDCTSHQAHLSDIIPSDIMSGHNISLPSCASGSDNEDGVSSPGSTPPTDAVATSVSSIPCSGPDENPVPVQSHSSAVEFTDAELWNSHAKNRAVIPGATGPPGTFLPQVKTVSADVLEEPLDTSSSLDKDTYIWGACVSYYGPADQPITQHATRMSVCPNNEDHDAGLTYLTAPGYQSAYEVASACSDRFGHLIEKVVSAVNDTELKSVDAFSHFETLISSQLRGEGTKAQFQAGYERVESGMDSYIDGHWKATIAADPSAEARRRAYDSKRMTWVAVSEFSPDTWLPESSERSDEVGPQGSL
jgi:hypothetical protein